MNIKRCMYICCTSPTVISTTVNIDTTCCEEVCVQGSGSLLTPNSIVADDLEHYAYEHCAGQVKWHHGHILLGFAVSLQPHHFRKIGCAQHHHPEFDDDNTELYHAPRVMAETVLLGRNRPMHINKNFRKHWTTGTESKQKWGCIKRDETFCLFN